MNVQFDYQKRIEKIHEEMEKEGIDLLVATRPKSINYIAGAFVPWRSVVLVSRDGYVGLNTILHDYARVSDESWLSNITPTGPAPGMELWEVTVRQIIENGLDKGVIGIELGHSPRIMTGWIMATERDYLVESLPKATFTNACPVTDRALYIKEPGEVKLLRQASAIADAGQERVRESVRIGMSETEIAGIAELELRKKGSEFHWAVTGSTEIASGYRSCYPMGGCNPASEKLVQRGETLMVDIHPTYRHYYADLAHNYILGKPTPEQQKLSDAYTSAVELLVSSFKAGSKIGDVFKTVNEELTRTGYAPYTVPCYGHGIGIIGHEWYPAIMDNDEFRDIVLEENVVEVAFMQMNVPGVGGMRLEANVLVTAAGGEMLHKTPLRPTVLDL
ncbi:MAG: aminopeptidase P family protein [Deltaproteobacteria bacterium]|nr:aminopeptidase P family protein [Candidatus Zymogenaceae bacterium]